MKRKLKAYLMILAMVASLLPLDLFAVTARAAEQVTYGIPAEVEGCWHYTGQSAPATAATTWLRGNAYGRQDHDYMNGMIDTSTGMYESASQELQKDEYLKAAQICILYLEGCPYSKSYLPQYQAMAQNSGAKVLLADVNKYRTASLLPYYNCMFEGTVSPVVLYKRADGTLQGKGEVHSKDVFAEILKECGYTVGEYAQEDKGYDKEQEKKDEILREVNRQRISQGLLPLSTYQGLQDVADFRAEETVDRMSHERPNNTLFVTALEEKGLTAPNHWGENLCAGPIVATPSGAMIAWMNSPGHRANILSGKYSHIGVGHYTNMDMQPGKYADYWVQLFSGTCQVTELSLDQQTIQVAQGTPVTDMGITVHLKCSVHGTTTMPLIDEMCTGYDMNKPGEQCVAVHYGELTTNLYVTVGETERAQLTDEMVTLSQGEFGYNGLPQTPEVQVTNPAGEYPLMEGYSYSVEYRDNVNVGTGSVVVTGKGNYTGSVTKTFQIARKDLSQAEFKGLEERYEYTGKAITPSFNITCDGVTLHEGRDYTVTYTDNIGAMKDPKKGTATLVDEERIATITVEGIGNYTGSATATFGFKMNDIHRRAQQMIYKLNPSHSNESTYDLLKHSKEAYTPDQFDLIIKNIEAVIKKREEEGVLDAIRACPFTSEANERINDYYRFVREYVDEINVADVVKEPEVASSAITKAEVAGLEALINSSSESVELSISDYTSDQKLEIDSSKYDSVNAVPLDIKLHLDGKEISDPAQAVTITVDIPSSLKAEDDLVVLHYTKDKKDNKDKVEVLETRVNADEQTLSFVTTGFSPFVITRRLEQYHASVNETTVNTGVAYGEEMPQAPGNVKFTSVTSGEEGGTVAIEWDKVETDPKWKVVGYLIQYADNERMEHADSVQVDSADVTSVELENISSEWCYVTVSTRATLAAMGEYAGEESLGESKVIGISVPKAEANSDPVDPPTDPVNPPTDPEDPSTDPVNPPTDPENPPTDQGSGSQDKDTGASGNQDKDAGASGKQNKDTGASGNQNKDAGASGNQNKDTGASGNQNKNAGASGNQAKSPVEKDKAANTGDSSFIYVWMMLMVLSAATSVFALWKKKRQ